MQILHSKIYGQEKNGTTLLVFHGLFGMLDNWGSFGKEFGELFPTHLIDLRNHGKSFHSDEMNHQVLAEDILNYMNFHGIEKANQPKEFFEIDKPHINGIRFYHNEISNKIDSLILKK